jgi:uncharacterized protein YbbK (DUF523 family)
MKIVSACLAGENCKWNGTNSLSEAVRKMVERGEAVAACPEVLGGLPVPRKPCGIYGGAGADVLDKKASVRAVGDGEDLTENFVGGAEEFLRIAKSVDADEAILKARSPSCGCGRTWRLDDRFENHVADGDGVTAALLKRNGIKVKAAIDSV